MNTQSKLFITALFFAGSISTGSAANLTSLSVLKSNLGEKEQFQ